MCHTSPLRAWARQGPVRCVGLIKLDCLAIIRARWVQALAMVVHTHLLCRGGGGRGGGGGATAGWPLTQRREEPRANADSCHGRGGRLAIISLSHRLYELWVVAFYTAPLKHLLRLFSVLKLAQLSRRLIFLHFYSYSFSAASSNCIKGQ